MKFYGGILTIAAILIILFYLLQEYESSSGSRPVATPAATATPGPTPDDAYPFSHTPAPGAVPAPPAAAQAPAGQAARPPVAAPAGPPAATDMRALIMSLAKQAGVQVVAYNDTGGWITVSVQGRERNNLNDFLDAAMRAGMKDMDEKLNQYKVITDRQLRQTHQNTYKMRF